SRALDLELAIMLETYKNDMVARIQRAAQLERQEVDRTLARAKNRYRHVVELVHVVLIGLDSKGIVRLLNREAERVTGFGREEVVGMPFAELLSTELRQEHGELVMRAAAGAPMQNDVLETAIRTKAGKVRDLRFHIANDSVPAPDADDDVVLLAAGL